MSKIQVGDRVIIDDIQGYVVTEKIISMKKGFTLIELVIVIAIVSILGFLIAGLVYASNNIQQFVPSNASSTPQTVSSGAGTSPWIYGIIGYMIGSSNNSSYSRPYSTSNSYFTNDSDDSSSGVWGSDSDDDSHSSYSSSDDSGSWGGDSGGDSDSGSFGSDD